MISKVLVTIKNPQSLTYFSKFGFAIRTNQATVFGKPTKLEEYSRDLIRSRNEKEAKEREEQALKAAEAKELWLQNKNNDKNPINYVKVKVNPINSIIKINEENTNSLSQENSTHHPFVVLVQPRPPKIICEGLRRRVPCHLKKTLPLMRAITGKHVFDAISICLNQKTKAAKYVLSTLNMVKSHATQKGFDEARLYVTEAITGKHRRFKSLRYHAKGKSGMQKKNIIQLRIKLEERTVENIYKNIIQGQFSPALAYIMRKNFLANDADYETIRHYQYVLTAKGRQQRKLMFKRRVLKEYLELRKEGVKLSKKVIEQKILDEESLKLAEIYREKKSLDVTSALKDRQELFKKNEEASV